jgi:hypothetical protein
MLPEEAFILLEDEWWCPRKGGKSRDGGIWVGVDGSDKNSRSKPPALIFISVSFSGVIWSAIDELSAMLAVSELNRRGFVTRVFRIQGGKKLPILIGF